MTDSGLWGGAGKGGERATRGTVQPVRPSGASEASLPPAAPGDGGAGLRPAGAAAGQRREDLWSERAEAYRASATHAAGADLDLVVAWCEPGPGVTVLDVATGGGHVARRLREAGATLVTVDAAPGMEPDVVAPADHLPFADASFDAVACRIAAHHFPDVLAAITEMARVARDRVVICDNLFTSESAEEADRLRDPSHVRNYAVAEWHSFFELAGLEVVEEALMVRETDFEDWLARTETPDQDRPRVRELLDHRVRDGRLELPTVVLKGKKP